MSEYAIRLSDVIEKFSSSIKTGLTSLEADQRKSEYGLNVIEKEKKASAFKIFIQSLSEPITLILWATVFLTFLSSAYDFFGRSDLNHALSSVYEAIAITIIIFVNAGLNFFQKMKARKSLDALRKISDRQVQVIRDGKRRRISALDLVPGDIVEAKMGDFIEADIRWLQTSELQVVESHLTGESTPILKNNRKLAKDTQLAERKNMGFSGSTVVNGTGIGIVVATGPNTEIGKIAGLLQKQDFKQTPIEKSIHQLTKKIMLMAAFVVGFSFIYDLFKQYFNEGSITVNGVFENISSAIALSVGAIPDALPVVLSIVLTIGARIMAKNKGLVKSLASVETLGSTNFIASDKTGTLTKNEMTVTNFFINGASDKINKIDRQFFDINDPYQAFFISSVLNNEIELSKENVNSKIGNPTDIALADFSLRSGFSKKNLLDKHDFKIIKVFPFDSKRKMMSTIIQVEDKYYLLAKGAPDILAKKANDIFVQGKKVDFTVFKNDFDRLVSGYAKQALRTIAIAISEITGQEAVKADQLQLENKLTLLGLVGIIDPPREEVKKLIATLKRASVKVVMITGDHADTAKAIAKNLGIIDDDSKTVVTGKEIESMSDQQLKDIVLDKRVYARVSPDHKQRIVKALQAHSQIVAMTGDGVNDAPALRSADIGISMGINGTEVTKDSADLILLDDKFTTIEKSVESGRMIFANIRNFIRQELTTNVAEVMSILLGTFLITSPIGNISELTPTLTTLMILWVNMISDSLPSFALGYDKAQGDLMNEKPRKIDAPILSKNLLFRVFVRGSIMAVTVFATYIWAAASGMSASQSQTIAFLTLVFGQLWHVFDARSNSTLFRRNPFSNPLLIATVLFAALSSIFVTISPFFNQFMGTSPLSFSIYLAVAFLPALPTFALSIIKEILLSKKIKIDFI